MKTIMDSTGAGSRQHVSNTEGNLLRVTTLEGSRQGEVSSNHSDPALGIAGRPIGIKLVPLEVPR
jgi:hypothetical protein